MTTAAPHLLTDREAAELVRMPRQRLVRLAKAGLAPCVALPDGEIRFTEADLWAWVEACRRRLEGEAALT